MKKIFLLIVLFSIMLSIIPLSYALTATIDVPNTVIEGDLVSIDFGADELADLELYVDGTYLTNAPPYEWQTTTMDAGFYEFTVIAQNINGTANATANLEIVNSDLQINIGEPIKTEYATNIIPLSVTPESPVEFCYYVIGSESNLLTKEGNDYVGELIEDDGIYTIVFKCKQGSEIAQKEKTILIDTTAPNIIQRSPNNGVILSNPEIKITTDEISTCNIWNAANQESSSMQMSSVDKLTHITKLNLDDGLYNYYVRCSDVYGNQALPEQLNFEINNPTTAEIDLPNILGAGTHELLVKFTKEPKDPKLTYSFQEGGSGSIVLMKQSPTEWYGELLIESNKGEKIGSFSLKDESKELEIIDGKTFQIDTVKPEKITDLKAVVEDDGVELSWLSDEDNFIIYRTEGDEITYNNEYMRVDKNYFSDGSVNDGQTYYYAVAAIDKADNIGPLSRIVDVTLVPELNSPEQEYYVSELNDQIDSLLMDITSVYELLESEKDQEKIMIIQELHLLESLTKEKLKLEQMKKEILTIDSSEASAYADKITQVYAKLPKRLVVAGTIDYEQPTDVSVQNMLLPKLVSLLGIHNKNTYSDQLQSFMDSVKVQGKIITADITFYDAHTEGYTLIKKSLEFPQQPKDVALIEYIPVDLSKNIDITFMPEPVIVEQDKIFQYTIPLGATTYELKYLFNKKNNLMSSRNVRSVIFPVEAEDENLLTGNVIGNTSFSLTNSWFYVLGGVIIAGLLVYYFTLDANSGPGMKELIDALHKTVNRPTPIYYPQPKSYFPKRIVRKPIKKISNESLGLSRVLNNNLSDQSSNKLSNNKFDSPFDSLALPQLLLKAHNAIDNKNYAVAKELYAQAIDQMNNPVLNIDETHRLDTNLLYYKLLLYQKLALASAAATTNNRKDLDINLDHIINIARKVPETDSKLIIEAKDAYAKLKKVSNKLAIVQEVF